MDELKDFQKRYFQRLKEEEREELANNADILNSFKNFIAKKGIQLFDENFKFFRTIGIVAIYPNIVSYLHPNLICDKEGLFDFNILCCTFSKNEYGNGYLNGENFMLMAHPYFRRGFYEGNNYAPSFIDLFWNCNNSGIETYISIDTDRVRINVDDTFYFERDTWYGAKFEKNIEFIPDGNVKLRPPSDIDKHIVSFFFADAYSLDIKWSTKNGIKSFQAEEFKTENIKLLKNEIEYHPVRYIHAEYDLNKKHFRHFDGAIHLYTECEYYGRRDSDFNYNNKNKNHIKTLSQKLYKMNGVIDIAALIEFSCHFLTGNPLAFEYFEGKYPSYINEMLEKVRIKKNKESQIG